MDNLEVSKALYKGFPLPSYAWKWMENDFYLIDYNDAAERETKGKIAGILGQSLHQIYGDENPVITDIEKCYREKNSFRKEIEYHFVTTNKTSQLKTTYTYIHPNIVMVYTEDVTELRAMTEELRARESLFSAIVNGISEAVVAVDSNGRISFVNKSTTKLFEYEKEEMIGSTIELLVPVPSRSKHVDVRKEFMDHPRSRPMGKGLHLTARKQDGRDFPVEIGLNYVSIGDTTAVVAIISDITERRKAEMAIEEAARLDPLTSCLNRRAFLQVLSSEHSRSKRYNHQYSLIMGDIDFFKNINDSHGHDFGDRVLVEVAKTFHSGIRYVDHVCRWGGEEFLLLLPETNMDDAGNAAEKLREMMEKLQIEHEEKSISITMSFGVSSSNQSENAEALINIADQNLYRAKFSGRNRVIGA